MKTINISARPNLPKVMTGLRGRPATDWAQVVTNSAGLKVLNRNTSGAKLTAQRIEESLKASRPRVRAKVIVDGSTVHVVKK